MAHPAGPARRVLAVVITATLLFVRASIYTVAQLTEDDTDDQYTERGGAERQHLLTTIAIACRRRSPWRSAALHLGAAGAPSRFDRVLHIAEQTSAENLAPASPKVRGAGESRKRLVAASNAMLDRISSAVSGLCAALPPMPPMSCGRRWRC